MTEAAQTLSGATDLDLPEFDDPPASPWGLLRGWLDAAVARGVREPYAVVLATADAAGRASSRVLLVKDADEHGLVFTSAAHSRKGRDLAERPWASATFYWRETLQQITAAGPVERLPDDESDLLFAGRPRDAQAASAVSHQSAPLADEAALHRSAASLRDGDRPIPRPDGWAGYRLVPHELEFWYGSPTRLHRRLAYTRPAADAAWSHRRLQP
ncbi:phenazine biosynthesis FMN-dependent oxidase PhzG [Jiangella mangrovi]|uniref:Pyridoxamine 5'-phosphate oxidase n=1 Tax=Jiangella mangrovi TaxID=1524084 RepID=A0A7W9GRT5_9ACTN|nr:phenazine biosynthesis FMN-dependent oxidase PhzG [Jiangella mangrovi]MBB5788882.1 pyridoxamine 5'-phosphate oxidase [Jiangella mangrovi]